MVVSHGGTKCISSDCVLSHLAVSKKTCSFYTEISSRYVGFVAISQILPSTMNRKIFFHRCPDRDRPCFLCLQNSAKLELSSRCSREMKITCVDFIGIDGSDLRILDTGWQVGRTTLHDGMRSARLVERHSFKVPRHTTPRSDP